MRRVLLVGTLLAPVMLAACSGRAPESTSAAAPASAVKVPPLEEYRNGLTDTERQEFYHLSEGGEILPLALLRALSRARTPQDPKGDGLVPFTQNLERYGFIPDAVSSQNPVGLPVGMTVARSRLTNRVMVGFNCTTCHVGEVWKDGRRVRIDGGPNMIRLNDMFGDVKTELEATLKETGRRERFLADVIRYKREDDDRFPSDRTVADRVKDLRSDVDTAQAFKGYIEAMPLLKDMATVVNGYGRVDAFGVARNLLFGGDERNRRPQNAPVSLSYIWGMENTAWLQWGANMNSVMERNIGQSLGVGAVFNPDTFASTSRLDNLNKLEHLAYKLTPAGLAHSGLRGRRRCEGGARTRRLRPDVRELPREALRGGGERPGVVPAVQAERSGHEPAGRRELRSDRPRRRERAPVRRRGVQHPREAEEAVLRRQQRLGADAGRMGGPRSPAGAAHAQHPRRCGQVSGFEGRPRLSGEAAGGNLGDGPVSEQRIGREHVGSADGARGAPREVSPGLA